MSLQGINHYQIINEHWSTAGQLEASQYAWLANDGFNALISLNPNAPSDEAELCLSQGLQYCAVPVQFTVPTESQFDLFSQLLTQNAGQRTFICCGDSKQAIVFLALYRVCYQGWAVPDAFQFVHKVWAPDAVWRDFIAQQLKRFDIAA